MFRRVLFRSACKTNVPALTKHVGLAIKNDGLGIAKYPGYVFSSGKNFQPNDFVKYNANAAFYPQYSASQVSGQSYKIIILPTRHAQIGTLTLKHGESKTIEYELLCDGFHTKDALTIDWASCPESV